MNSIRLTMFRSIFLFLLLFVFICSAPHYVSARTHVVVDIEGTVEDYASLATISQSPSLRTQLSLVTISGVTWGHAASVARHVCRFLSLARLPGVIVSIGEIQATSDAYDAVLSRGKCKRSQGFPNTPQDSLRRGMTYSRSDITSVFGAAYTLPTAACSSVNVNASDALLSLISLMSLSDTISYIALAGSTNVVAAINYLGRRDPERLQRFKQAVSIHILEKSYSLAVDDRATQQLLKEAGLRLVIYMPPFYSPAISFTFGTWSRFSTLVQESGVAKSVAWLFNAWNAEKELIESRNGNNNNNGDEEDYDSSPFFNERGPASSLVTLCALDATVQASCSRYRTALSKISFQFDSPSSDNISYVISGSNVTWPSYLLVTVGDSRNSTRFLVAQSADILPPATAATLSSVFWSVWLDLLRL